MLSYLIDINIHYLTQSILEFRCIHIAYTRKCAADACNPHTSYNKWRVYHIAVVALLGKVKLFYFASSAQSVITRIMFLMPPTSTLTFRCLGESLARRGRGGIKIPIHINERFRP